MLSTKDYYSVPGIITQYWGLLLSTRDYPDFSARYCLSLALMMIMPSIMNFQQWPKQTKWCRFCQPAGGSFIIILIFETNLYVIIKDDYESELTWISNSEVMQPFWTHGPKAKT